MKHVNPDETRTPGMREIYDRIAREGFCPFDEEHFLKNHPNPILWKSDWWIVTTNMEPYEGTRIHLLFILRVHVTEIKNLPVEARIDMFDQVARAEREFDIRGAAIVFRFCLDEETEDYNGSSVRHVHFHIPVGECAKSDEAIRVRPKVGYGNPK